MSMHLKETPKNLNSSVWNYDTKLVFGQSVEDQKIRDSLITRKIISPYQTFKMSSECFDECVDNDELFVLIAKEYIKAD